MTARRHKPGDQIEYTAYVYGNPHQRKAIVTADHGDSVEARTPAGQKIRLDRASDGALRKFT